MDSDSRKAQRNSFAHHRAERLARGDLANDLVEWFAEPKDTAAPDRELFFAWRLPADLLGAASP